MAEQRRLGKDKEGAAPDRTNSKEGKTKTARADAAITRQSHQKVRSELVVIVIMIMVVFIFIILVFGLIVIFLVTTALL